MHNKPQLGIRTRAWIRRKRLADRVSDHRISVDHGWARRRIGNRTIHASSLLKIEEQELIEDLLTNDSLGG